MQVILDTALPFFALVFCGYGAGRFGLLSEASASGLNTFVFYFALPAFIFSLLATAPIDNALNASFAAAYLIAGLGVAAVAGLPGVWFFGAGKSSAVLRGASASLGNTGYMGLPLIAAAGPCALFTLGATLAGREISGGLAEVSYLTFFKLAVHPASMWLTMSFFDVNPLWTKVAILGASLPVAANVFILARQYETYVDRTSGAILASTIVSVATVSGFLILLT